ncbi:hypothetical protein GRF59_14765 [Paenibacillus sp. HJL G12]|uniref:SMI1/KNR4 family protein n=1 Tax=Paenibacillus dendrobii TaxID=2691084 RepID=A0A7X3IK80_9BACL|nr:hypothetical protein [Paenibacillus dendrobii]MWV44881.1 hypothetical protein [Paenibacillus dendrobii]
METSPILLGLSNYYGEVIALESEGKYYMQLDDWNVASRIEISEEFFKAIQNEFK